MVQTTLDRLKKFKDPDYEKEDVRPPEGRYLSLIRVGRRYAVRELSIVKGRTIVTDSEPTNHMFALALLVSKAEGLAYLLHQKPWTKAELKADK